jgi:hypothetical protein
MVNVAGDMAAQPVDLRGLRSRWRRKGCNERTGMTINQYEVLIIKVFN